MRRQADVLQPLDQSSANLARQCFTACETRSAHVELPSNGRHACGNARRRDHRWRELRSSRTKWHRRSSICSYARQHSCCVRWHIGCCLHSAWYASFIPAHPQLRSANIARPTFSRLALTDANGVRFGCRSSERARSECAALPNDSASFRRDYDLGGLRVAVDGMVMAMKFSARLDLADVFRAVIRAPTVGRAGYGVRHDCRSCATGIRTSSAARV